MQFALFYILVLRETLVSWKMASLLIVHVNLQIEYILYNVYITLNV